MVRPENAISVQMILNFKGRGLLISRKGESSLRSLAIDHISIQMYPLADLWVLSYFVVMIPCHLPRSAVRVPHAHSEEKKKILQPICQGKRTNRKYPCRRTVESMVVTRPITESGATVYQVSSSIRGRRTKCQKVSVRPPGEETPTSLVISVYHLNNRRFRPR